MALKVTALARDLGDVAEHQHDPTRIRRSDKEPECLLKPFRRLVDLTQLERGQAEDMEVPSFVEQIPLGEGAMLL